MKWTPFAVSHHNLPIIEDAAQGILSTYGQRPLGSIGSLAALSFHETKNIMAGEGGALLINDSSLIVRAEMIREKGTDRSRFFRGEVDKYTWQLPGSSFLPGELTAAFLRAQLEHAGEITKSRMALWQNYHKLLEPLEAQGLLRRPVIPDGCGHNAHIYHVLLDPEHDRDQILASMRKKGIHPVFHYVPLHSSPAGSQSGRAFGSLDRTDHLSSHLIRLPLWIGLRQSQQEHIVNTLGKLLTI